MDKSQIVLALIGSAAVGALVSSIVTIVGKWRERVARRKELLFASAVDLAKVSMSRAPTQGPAGRIMEVALVPSFHAMLTEIFGTGDLSEKHQQFIGTHLESIGRENLDRLTLLQVLGDIQKRRAKE